MKLGVFPQLVLVLAVIAGIFLFVTLVGDEGAGDAEGPSAGADGVSDALADGIVPPPDALTSPAPDPSEAANKPTPQDLPQLLPEDAGSADPDFVAVRQALRRAIDDRDLAALMVHVAVENAPPGAGLNGEGAQSASLAFEQLLLDEDVGEAYWLNLADTVQFGAIERAPGQLCSPYFACLSLPQVAPGVNPYNAVVLVGESVAIYEAPDLNSAVIDRVSHRVAELGSFVRDPDWIEIRLPDGQEGYVERVKARSPLGFRAIFEKREARWKLISLGTGDS